MFSKKDEGKSVELQDLECAARSYLAFDKRVGNAVLYYVLYRAVDGACAEVRVESCGSDFVDERISDFKRNVLVSEEPLCEFGEEKLGHTLHILLSKRQKEDDV
jgi:hypothetical protein